MNRLEPKNRRISRGVEKSKSQPFITIDQFAEFEQRVAKPRDRIILRILFLCAVRGSELFVLKWKDFAEQDGRFILNIERSFCSRTHRVKRVDGEAGRRPG